MFQNLAYAKRFQQHLEGTTFPESPAHLYDPIRYMLSLGGKRIRPMLALMGAELFDAAAVEAALPASTAIEFFHNFSLIHDDIMDRAPLRRGQATVHHKWDDTIAILSGDALLVKAYEELAKCEATKVASLLKVFNKLAVEVCEGQQLDMDFEKIDFVEEAQYIEMIRLKTSVLLGGALQMGAIIGGADADAQALIYDFGVNLGIAFQLQDDILDVYGDPETFGKQVGGDILSNKKTMLHIKLKSLISDADRPLLADLLSNTSHDDVEKIAKMKALYAKYEIKAFAEKRKEEFTAIAYKKLHAIAIAEERKAPLFALADALMHREN